ncbi:MAG: hybrid sensor histidine kinase/response regulator [Elusimicrobiota bacterium]
MDIEKLLNNKKLLAIFKDETNEHVLNISNFLIELEQEPGKTELLESIYREAHTLKGSSKMMGFMQIGTVAHKMEDLLQVLKDGKVEFSDSFKEVIYNSLETVRLLMEEYITGKEKKISIEEICAKLEAAKTPGQPAEAAEIPKKKQKLPDKHKKGGIPSKKKSAEESDSSDKEKRKAIDRRKGYAIPEPGDTVRVDILRLDELINLAGEIETNRIKFEEREKDLLILSEIIRKNFEIWDSIKEEMEILRRRNTFSEEFDGELASFELWNRQASVTAADFATNFGDDIARISIYLRELYAMSMDMRMLPISVIFDLFPYTIQQIAGDYGKKVKLQVFGESTKLDKKIIDGIRDPLLHIINNSVAHGIESVDIRIEQGKTGEGNIKMDAFQEGDSVIIEISDDGSGFDIDKIKAEAIERGLLSDKAAKHLDEDDIVSFVFESGFSTASEVSELSGRGVGMGVVKAKVEDIGGNVRIRSVSGEGATVRLQLPITLTTGNVLLVGMGNQTFAIPATGIDTTVRVDPKEIKVVKNKKAVVINEKILPLVDLADILDMKVKSREDNKLSIVVMKYGQQRMALSVGRFIGSREIVIKNLGDYLSRIKCISGATIMPNGDVVFILHIPFMFSSVETSLGTLGIFKKSDDMEIKSGGRKYSVLVVDDAVTTRELERQILEAGGYDAEVASDGLEALDKIKTGKYDLVITDIQMPEMDGLQLVRELRQSEQYGELPIIIVTGLGAEEDVRKGMEAGATAYFVKSDFDQVKLVETVKRLIERKI